MGKLEIFYAIAMAIFVLMFFVAIASQVGVKAALFLAMLVALALFSALGLSLLAVRMFL